LSFTVAPCAIDDAAHVTVIGAAGCASSAGRPVRGKRAILDDGMTDRDPMLEPFDALVGTWSTEANHRAVDGVVPGTYRRLGDRAPGS